MVYLGEVTCPCGELAGTVEFSTYNLITLNDYSTSSEVDNRTIVCGSFISNVSSNFGNHASSTMPKSTPVLEINGEIVTGDPIQINQGSLAVSCRPQRNLTNTTEPVKYQVDGREFNINGAHQGATAFIDKELKEKCINITANILLLSNNLAELSSTPDNSYQGPSMSNGHFNFYVTSVNCRGVAVFNFSADNVWGSDVNQIEFHTSLTNISLIIINLSGENVTLGSGTNINANGILSSGSRGIVLWHLWEAKTVKLETALRGALLAPYATVTTAQVIDGAVAVRNMLTTNELHNPYIDIPKCLG